ncbi:MAG: PspA/IM30 family protein [Cyanobacteria bacterium SZAS LIN-2]|nr:PspA/IM30 family protein [Cyanobacteria bacterium SZAS LIN-2]
MFERLLSIFRGTANKAVSKLETPEILAEQAQMQLESNFKSLTEAVTTAITTQKQLEQQVKKNEEEIATWEKRAGVAVQNNNDEIAKQCLEKKQALKQHMQGLAASLEEQKSTVAKLKKQHSDAEEQLRQFNIKKQGIIARAKAADNQEKASKIISGSGSSSMDALEQKIRDKELRNEAVNEMSGKGKLDDQFKELDKLVEVDDELTALKAKIAANPAIGGSTPKLIVAKEGQTQGKTQVDENLPMVVDVEVAEE